MFLMHFRPYITERFVMGRKESNQIKQTNKHALNTSHFERIIDGLRLIRLFSDSQNAAFELLVWFM